jgi:ethanolamine kinase
LVSTDCKDCFTVADFCRGIWALVQGTISDIDFDYKTYAQLRLGEFQEWKAEQSGLEVSPADE